VLGGAIDRRLSLQRQLEPLPLQISSGPLHLLAFTPRGLTAAAAEQWSIRTRQLLLEAGLMLSRPLYAGRHHLKAVLGNPHTGPRELHTLAELVGCSLDDPGHG